MVKRMRVVFYKKFKQTKGKDLSTVKQGDKIYAITKAGFTNNLMTTFLHFFKLVFTVKI